MTRRAWLALALAPVIPLIALPGGGGLILVLGLAGDIAFAWLVTRELATPRRPGASSVLDVLAWLLGSGALAGSTLLASPFPHYVATPGPGRTAALLFAAVTAVASAAIVLRRPPGP